MALSDEFQTGSIEQDFNLI